MDKFVKQSTFDANADKQLKDASDVAALTDLPAFGATYSQAELNALRTSHNKVLEVLRDSGLIPSA